MKCLPMFPNPVWDLSFLNPMLSKSDKNSDNRQKSNFFKIIFTRKEWFLNLLCLAKNVQNFMKDLPMFLNSVLDLTFFNHKLSKSDQNL